MNKVYMYKVYMSQITVPIYCIEINHPKECKLTPAVWDR